VVEHFLSLFQRHKGFSPPLLLATEERENAKLMKRNILILLIEKTVTNKVIS
jgi:hypothetical protein